jgi:peptidoglycan hydrolase-like protein with peptidoglycan-binding domain
MKKTLTEELERIHELTYGKELMIDENFFSNLVGKVKKIFDPKKADLVSDDVNKFYKTLEDAANNGGLTQQGEGSMTYQRAVESMQIGLITLGYDLPVHGVDGLFGPETGNAVSRFIKDHVASSTETGPQTMVGANTQTLLKMVELLKQKGLTSEDLKQNSNQVTNIPTDMGNVNTDTSKYVINYLMTNGEYTAVQAAGIAGNLQVESGFNPNIQGDKNLSTPSVGIAQWREDRLHNLQMFAQQNGRSWNDLNVQLSFIIYELKTRYKNVDSLIRQSNDVNQIVQIVQSKYEVSTPQSLGSRQQYANLFYNDYVGDQGERA